MSNEELGPLAALVGTWEGDKGDDIAPGDDRAPTNSKFRERLSFEPTGQVDNHEQTLYGLRYRTTAWRLGADAPFHEELGYWMWDRANQTVMRCFVIPRGITVLAGGTAKPDARSFDLKSELGSQKFGICSAPFLDENFQTTGYELHVEIPDDETFSYRETTFLQMKGHSNVFRHTDENSLKRV